MKYTCMIKSLSIACIAFLSFSGLAACSEKRGGVISGKIPQQGKPVAPISISYTVPEKAAVGETVNVTVKFEVLSDVEGLNLKLAAGEGLRMTLDPFEVNYGNQSAKSTFSELVTVTAKSEGVLYLNVFVTGTFNGRRMVRTVAVPISVGSDARRMLKKPDKVTTDSEGRQIIIMPTIEENE